MIPPGLRPTAAAQSLPGLLRANAYARGDAVALFNAERSVSFGALLEGSGRLAAVLHDRGIRRGVRVGLLQANGAAFVECLFAIGILGAVAVPFSTWSTPAELAFLLVDSDVSLVLAQSTFGDRDMLADLQDACFSSGRDDLAAAILTPGPRGGFGEDATTGLPASDWTVRPEDVAMILYTSGSTSRPKGVRLTQQGCAVNGFHIGQRQGLGPDDRVFLSAPLFWSYGLANALPATFGHGAALVLAERFEPEAAQKLIQQHRCTSIYTLPAMTEALLNAPGFNRSAFGSLRTGMTIGSAADLRRAADGLGIPEICNIYGATETYGNCCVTWHHWPLDKRMACQGPPLPGQSLRFRHPETGALLTQGETGLVEVSGRVSPGYTGASEQHNATAFTRDGYYCTGDLGHLDAEGNFHFTGRDSDMIKRSGINVSPSEVEVALQALPAVAQCCVVGVPDTRHDEAIVALVVPAPGWSVEVRDIRARLRESLSSYKLPDHVLAVTALPLTATGKIQRRQARDEAIRHFSISKDEVAS